VQFNIPRGPAVTFGPSFGLNDNSVGVLWRFQVSYEIGEFLGMFHSR